MDKGYSETHRATAETPKPDAAPPVAGSFVASKRSQCSTGRTASRRPRFRRRTRSGTIRGIGDSGREEAVRGVQPIETEVNIVASFLPSPGGHDKGKAPVDHHRNSF